MKTIQFSMRFIKWQANKRVEQLIIGLPRKAESITVEDTEEMVKLESFLEHILGIRVHVSADIKEELAHDEKASS